MQSLIENRLLELKGLLEKIAKGQKVENLEYHVYASMEENPGDTPKGYRLIESTNFREQARFVKDILQHKNCPPGLKLLIHTTENYGTMVTFGQDRVRAPIKSILEGLTGGKCVAANLTIHLVGDDSAKSHLLPDEAALLAKGLSDGKCPKNLLVKVDSLDVRNQKLSENCPNIYDNFQKLISAKKSSNCSFGFKIDFKKSTVNENTYNTLNNELLDQQTNLKQERENASKVIESIKSSIEIQVLNEIKRLNSSQSTDCKTRKTNIDELSGKIAKYLDGVLKVINNPTEDLLVKQENNENNLQSGEDVSKAIFEQDDIDTSIGVVNNDNLGDYSDLKLFRFDLNWNDSLFKGIAKIIDEELRSKNFKKEYNYYKELGIKILNIVTGILFPLALVKYATTGSLFYSTVGKTQETVDKVRDIAQQNLKQ